MKAMYCVTKSLLTGLPVLSSAHYSSRVLSPCLVRKPWRAWKRNSFSRSRARIVGYTPLPSLSSLTVLMYRLLRSLWRGPLYVSSLNRILASIGRLPRRWAGPFLCALGRPLLWIARNVRIVGWQSPAGVWMVSPPHLS